MEELDDNSVQLIITSPPYGKIKDYGLEDQIGFSDSFEDYFKRLKNVWKECYRVLEPHCRMVINIGDQYLRTTHYGRYRILSITSNIINNCIELGFDFLGDIIWQKISTTNTTGGCTFMGSIYYPRNGLLTYDYEHILIFKKYKGKKKIVDIETKELSKISLSEWKKWYVGHWRFPGMVQKEHIAMFPEELPYRIIRMFSFIGDKVLDPFVGSGTTLKVAKFLYRKGIGYEINENFKKTIEHKIKSGSEGVFKDYQYLLHKIYQKSLNENIKIVYEKQKQKGIIILNNDKSREIIIDYLLIDEFESDSTNILKEFKIKLEENTIKNYLEESVKGNAYKNYIIIINSQSQKCKDIMKLCKENLKSFNLPKPIQLISFEDFILESCRLGDFF
ncbi:MAG: site-specific DNA-methyltransferase [Promethearchaeota archaeon]|nr:MAG: site-specific DNA-methyltransferase [Candidatus Lokiarchaeota archaeon]